MPHTTPPLSAFPPPLLASPSSHCFSSLGCSWCFSIHYPHLCLSASPHPLVSLVCFWAFCSVFVESCVEFPWARCSLMFLHVCLLLIKPLSWKKRHESTLSAFPCNKPSITSPLQTKTLMSPPKKTQKCMPAGLLPKANETFTYAHYAHANRPACAALSQDSRCCEPTACKILKPNQRENE